MFRKTVQEPYPFCIKILFDFIIFLVRDNIFFSIQVLNKISTENVFECISKQILSFVQTFSAHNPQINFKFGVA